LRNIGALAAAVLVAAVILVGGSPPGAEAEIPCPTIGPFSQVGTLGQVATDPVKATVGVSGLGESRFNANASGQRIAWAVGDRSANELAGPDRVFVFGLDARDGSLAVRYPIDPSSLQDDPIEPSIDSVTKLGQTANPIPDLEALSINDLGSAQAGMIWLFDTGDNGGQRPDLNAYVLQEPDLVTPNATGLSFMDHNVALDDAVMGPAQPATRYPIVLMNGAKQITPNVEAAFVDARTPGTGSDAVYLIPKSPVDRDGDHIRTDFRVFRFTSRNAADSGRPNVAQFVGYITLGTPRLKVTDAAASEDGTSFVIRAVSGGKTAPDQDVVAMWNRTPGATIEDDITARHVPDCSWSLNSAPSSSVEEAIAYDVTDGAWNGFIWTHDVPKMAAPFLFAPKT
jgi:hypothetical protein